MAKKNDLPAMPFYVGDWRKAPEIRALPLDARALWFEMLCIMWEAPRRGYLSIDGKNPIDDKTLARMVGEPDFVITKLKQVLERCCVYSVEEGTGIVYNRRMVKDEHIRASRAIAGRKGMNSRYKNRACYNKTDNKPTTNSITNTEDEDENEIENKNEDVKEGGCKGGDDAKAKFRRALEARAFRLLTPFEMAQADEWIEKWPGLLPEVTECLDKYSKPITSLIKFTAALFSDPDRRRQILRNGEYRTGGNNRHQTQDEMSPEGTEILRQEQLVWEQSMKEAERNRVDPEIVRRDVEIFKRKISAGQ